MIHTAFLALATAGAPASVIDEGILARCEQSAFPRECVEAGMAASHAGRLVRLCRRGSDELRFSDSQRGRAGVPIPTIVQEACGSAKDACMNSYMVFLDRRYRRLPDGELRVSEEEMRNYSLENCSLENHVLID